MKGRVFAVSLVCALSACGGDGLSAVQKEEYARGLVELFAQTCVASLGDAGKITAAARDMQRLSENDMKQLPFGMMEPDAKAAWKQEKNGAVYYLSLSQGGCSVKVARADADTVRSQFSALAAQKPQGWALELRGDHATQTPFPFSQLSYAWRVEGSPDEVVLTANTSSSRQLPAQAVLSLAHQSYGVRAVNRP